MGGVWSPVASQGQLPPRTPQHGPCAARGAWASPSLVWASPSVAATGVTTTCNGTRPVISCLGANDNYSRKRLTIKCVECALNWRKEAQPAQIPVPAADPSPCCFPSPSTVGWRCRLAPCADGADRGFAGEGFALWGGPMASAALCPRSLDCALQRREFCPPGSGACGPCLPAFQEDERGRCVQKHLSPSGRTPDPSLEEEIDLLADVLARQEAPHPHPRDGKPRATLLPAGGRQRVASGLREELLQQGPTGSKAAATLPISTTTAVQKHPVEASPIPSNDNAVLGLIVVCTVAGLSALVMAVICWCRLQKEVRLAQKADYSAQRVASPLPYDKISPGDKTLAQSAQMYHYQHQKQQMLSMEKHKEEPKLPDSASSDEENEDGDFTVYECPGLAPTGEMEVRNPLFDDSSLHPSNPKSHQ